MKILRVFLLKQFFLVFLAAMMFFILILEIGDMFPKLETFSNNEVSFSQILTNILYYVPKCISYAVPISLLFSISYTLGNLYMNNELINIFGSGISLLNFVLPLIISGVLISAGMFVFTEKVVIDTYIKKQEYTNMLMKRKPSYSNQNVAEMGDSQKIVYSADYYNDNNESLTGVTIVEYDDNHAIIRRVDAEYAEWDGTKWLCKKARVFIWDSERKYLTEEYHPEYENDKYSIVPDRFRKVTQNVDEMTITEAQQYIEQMKNATPNVRRGIMTNYYEKFSYALSPLVVVIISCAIGGRFKKNILLLSLSASLVVAVVYYVVQMLAVLMAKQGYISPLLGAWFGIIIISAVSALLYKFART
ncbi:MAG: LptF/LptG family permease [Spirochaetales bacterium]|nr:LptF/LptG family permease [Spirochaetales bacterium]